MSRYSILLMGVAASLALAACSSSRDITDEELRNRGHYWQRSSATSALYLRGPKAQQMLHRDLSRCVVEIRELERLGSIRHHMPAETENGTFPDPASSEGQLAGYETPEKEGYLYAEHLDYHDLESCMMSKGWERVEHVPYNVGERARETYIETIVGEQYQSKYGNDQKNLLKQKEGDFENLNQ